METKANSTTTENQTDTSTINGTTEFSRWIKEMARLAQEGVKKEIARHKAAGNPIFYSRNGVLIKELADGRCFEYRLQEDGTEEIIRELPRRCQKQNLP